MPGARVVVANYQALRHDFPHAFGASFRERFADDYCASCRVAGRLCNQAIDRWIIQNSAHVSLQQARPNGVNSPIRHGPPTRRGYRPPFYGRALVVPIGEPGGEAGLFDIKGAGVAPGVDPGRGDHMDGLEYLGVALGDFFYGWLIDRIFARTVPGYSTVPVYAVLDLGFDILDGWQGTAPAGLHVRRAHSREQRGLQLPMSGSDGERVRIQMELILRAYGLTTATSNSSYRTDRTSGEEVVNYYGRRLTARNEEEAEKLRIIAQAAGTTRLEHSNLQLIRDLSWEPKSAQMVDFGHVHARQRFRYPLAIPVRDTHFSVGRIIPRDDPAFVQPLRGTAIDGALFSRAAVNAFGFYVAQCFRDGRMNSRVIGMILRRALRRTGI